MSDFILNEQLILSMMDRLENMLPGVIEAINAERGTDTDPPYLLDPPVQVLDAVPTAGELQRGFPLVALVDGVTTFTDDIGWNATGVHEMTIVAYLQDADPRALAWKLRRYSQALVTVALYGRNVDAGAWGTTLQRIVPGNRLSPTDPKAVKSFLSWIAVQIQARNEQETP